ncbi:glycosyltransferase [Sphingomonas sp. BIUV-7]|uniref:Glycosyltransferase n=1 Tax=Sphingomonas natans TaxID=3063330 RepID=A0ABT8Y479_9SPHN|nr:glycosyltransferase [Sphingomonas sp. BIUV-7]MDO6413122.1 glycosyltransferase [Sphingomonas sp. BIUV-7]
MAPVYLYVHDLRSSGVVRDAITIATLLAAERPTILVTAYADGLWRDGIDRRPFDMAVLRERQGMLPRVAAIAPLRRWLRRQPPGLLFSFGNHGHSTAYLATRGLDHIRRAYRISNEIVRPDGRGNRRRTWWMRRLIADAARIVLVGQALGRHAVFAEALESGRAMWVPSGVERTEAIVSAQAPCPHPWLEEEVPVVIAVGRLRPQKNLDVLIAAAGLARRERRLRLILLGGGTVAEQVRLIALARDTGFQQDFLLAGETSNVFAWLVRAAVFALPSRWEGSSLALLEAMAVGTPVVASRLAGDATDVLAAGRYGALFDGSGPVDLAARLLHQLSDDRIMPGERAADYDLAAIAARYSGIIADMSA